MFLTALLNTAYGGLKLPTLRQRLFRCVSIRENDDGTYAITAVQHVPEKEAIVDIENTPDGMQSQVLLAADRIAMVNPANGNTKPMFVGQGDQIFMNDVFLKRLTAPHHYQRWKSTGIFPDTGRKADR